MKFVVIWKCALLCLIVESVCARRGEPKKLRMPLRPNEVKKVYDHSESISLRSPFTINANDFIRYRNVPIANVIPQEDNCKNPEFRKKLEKGKGSVACKLMDTVVHIKSQDQSVLTPSAVLVKRCSGVCGANVKKQCIPQSSVDRTFHVRQILKDTNIVKCLTVQVSEDVVCGCDCPQKEKDCKKDVQIYNKDRCLCECVNDYEFKKCKQRIGKNWNWNQKECACTCKETKVCTTGAKWNEKHCKCKKVKSTT